MGGYINVSEDRVILNILLVPIVTATFLSETINLQQNSPDHRQMIFEESGLTQPATRSRTIVILVLSKHGGSQPK